MRRATLDLGLRQGLPSRTRGAAQRTATGPGGIRPSASCPAASSSVLPLPPRGRCPRTDRAERLPPAAAVPGHELEPQVLGTRWPAAAGAGCGPARRPPAEAVRGLCVSSPEAAGPSRPGRGIPGFRSAPISASATTSSVNPPAPAAMPSWASIHSQPGFHGHGSLSSRPASTNGVSNETASSTSPSAAVTQPRTSSSDGTRRSSSWRCGAESPGQALARPGDITALEGHQAAATKQHRSRRRKSLLRPSARGQQGLGARLGLVETAQVVVPPDLGAGSATRRSCPCRGPCRGAPSPASPRHRGSGRDAGVPGSPGRCRPGLDAARKTLVVAQ